MSGEQRLASYRPTIRQTAGRGLLAGMLAALIGGAIIVTIRVLGGDPPPLYLLLLCIPLGCAVVFVLLMELSSQRGVDATPRGIVRVGAGRSTITEVPWHQITEISMERRGGRTVVVVRLDSGASWLLPAPYQGLWLTYDPQFERKFLTLRNLWETYRTWTTGARSRSQTQPQAESTPLTGSDDGEE